MTSYAYVHFLPNDKAFYVGKGALRRAKSTQSSRNKHYQGIVAKHGKDNIGIAVFECSTEDIAFELEYGLIKCLRRAGHKLCNQNDGGKGGKNLAPDVIEKFVKIH